MMDFENKEMIFITGVSGNGSNTAELRLVTVLRENKSVTDGIYIRYASGGTDTTQRKFLFDIPVHLQDRLTSAESENKKLREVVSSCAKAVGGVISTDASIEFICELPNEVQLVMAGIHHTKAERDQYKAQIDAAQRQEPVYQVMSDNFCWSDVSVEYYDILTESPFVRKRIVYNKPPIPQQPKEDKAEEIVQADYILDYEYDEGEENPDLGGDLIFHSLNGKEFPRGTLFYAAPPKSVEISGESDEPLGYYYTRDRYTPQFRYADDRIPEPDRSLWNEAPVGVMRSSPNKADVPDDKVLIDKSLIDFLNGEDELNGLWFDELSGSDGQYWWRKYLPSISPLKED
jgi:uncharacterized small protein (DUF1192 family)